MADVSTDARLERLPSDALVLLVGPSGSGKSTWAGARFAPGAVLSSDAFRALVAGDAADQSATADAFKVLHTVARARLRRGLLTVVDATNLTEGARRSLLRLAARAERPAVAVAFAVSLERCLAQNAARPGRRVPDEVVRRHHRDMQRALEHLPREGFARVHILGDAEMRRARPG
ncbi:MAG: AAA family ATPase [Candidatus Limnocylindrales bacterium]